jgi:hypothetical protein
MSQNKRKRGNENELRQAKREARGEDWVTYKYSEHFEKEVRTKFEKLGYVFVRGVVNPFTCSLLDQLIQLKMEGETRLIMGRTKIIECTTSKDGELFQSIHAEIEPIFKYLLSLLYGKDDQSLQDIHLVEKVVFMLKEAMCEFSQLPHADSMGNDIRMLLFTRYTDYITTSNSVTHVTTLFHLKIVRKAPPKSISVRLRVLK